MPISSYKVFLMRKADVGGNYDKMVDIKDFPDLGGAPETIDTTTLSDYMRTSILGIQELDNMQYTANYDLEAYKKLKALEGQQLDLAVWFGGTGQGSTLTPTGEFGKFKFKGEISVYPNGGGVNEVVNMTISIAPSTPIELDETE